VTHSDSTGRNFASGPARARLYYSTQIISVAGAGLGAALLLFAAGPADAAYYYYGNYGYYGHGYRDFRPAAVSVSRQARSAKKKSKKPGEERAKAEPPKPIKGPLTIVVSIGDQRVRVFDQTSQIAEAPTSTGTRGFPTPMGVFTVIQKDRYHRSNLYNGAPMPYMQRLTWSGTAMHTGVLPGYPASHGCIRLPNSFASRLWTMTKLGTRVIVARHGLHPAPITHAKLDSLKAKPADTTPMAQGASGKTAANEGPMTDGFSTPMPNLSADQFKPVTKILNEPTPPAAEPLAAPAADPVAAPPPKPALKPGPVAIFISKKEGKLFVRKGFEPVFDVPVRIENPEIPLGTHIYTATENKDGDLAMHWMAVSLPADARAEPRADTKRGKTRGEKPAAKPAPAAAVAASSSATEALDRVELPAEALERLAELLTPGASLIISDKGLGHQTGKGTEFIVLSR
jgi:L,D-transpeptidase catalytic domain